MAKQTTFETDNGKYIFQHPGIRFSEQMKDEAKDQNGKFMPQKYHKKTMENVIVEPKVDYDYFDELEKGKTKTLKPSDTEYTLVYPDTKTISEMQYYFLDGRGRMSELNAKEQFMKHIIKVDENPVTFEFFDELGDIQEYNEVISAAKDFLEDTEFLKVVNAAGDFLRGQEV